MNKHGAKIKAEVDELFRNVVNPDALDLTEALSNVCDELPE